MNDLHTRDHGRTLAVGGREHRVANLRDVSGVPRQARIPVEERTPDGAGERQEPRLVRGAGGRVYVTTSYRERDGTVVPRAKHDVTEDFELLTGDPHLLHGPALHAIATRVYELAHDDAGHKSDRARIGAIAAALAYTFRGPHR